MKTVTILCHCGHDRDEHTFARSGVIERNRCLGVKADGSTCGGHIFHEQGRIMLLQSQNGAYLRVLVPTTRDPA